jgi:WD40 repeat protein
MLYTSSVKIEAQAADVVTPENVTQITQLARLGRGSASYLDWHPEGEMIALGGGWGMWLLDQDFQEVLHFTDLPRMQDLVWHPFENLLATLHFSEIRLWRVANDFSSVTLENSFLITPVHMQYGMQPLDRCLSWSDDGRVIAVGTAPVRERIADNEPIPEELRLLEFYRSDNGDTVEIPHPELERQVSARCRYGAVSPDGKLETFLRYGYLAGDHFIRVFFVPSLEEPPLHEFTLSPSEVYAMDWHPSGKSITMIHQFRLINWTFPDFQSESYTFFNGFISSLQWSPDGKMLLAGSEHTSSAYLWHQQAGSTSFDEIGLNWVNDGMARGGLGWLRTGEMTSCTAEYAYWRCDIVDVENREIVRRVTESQDRFQMAREERYHTLWNADFTRYVLFDQGTSTIVVAGFEAEPVSVIWNIDIGRYVVGEYSTEGSPLPELQLPGTFEQYHSMEWVGDELYITVGDDNTQQTIFHWDEETNTLEAVAAVPRQAILRPFDLIWHDVPDPVFETRVQWDLTVLNPENGEPLSFTPDIPVPDASICGGDGCRTFMEAVHPEGRLAVLNTRGGFQFWSLEDGSLLYTVQTERDITSFVWDQAGKHLAAGSMDGTVYVFGIQ